MVDFNMIDNGEASRDEGKQMIKDAMDKLPENVLGFIFFAAVPNENGDKINLIVKDFGMPPMGLLMVGYAAIEAAKHFTNNDTDPNATFEDHKVQ